MSDVVFDTPEGIEMFRLLALRGALSIYIHTRMKPHAGWSPTLATQEMLNLNYRPRNAKKCYYLVDKEVQRRFAELKKA